jgi:hypothetical protein
MEIHLLGDVVPFSFFYISHGSTEKRGRLFGFLYALGSVVSGSNHSQFEFKNVQGRSKESSSESFA